MSEELAKDGRENEKSMVVLANSFDGLEEEGVLNNGEQEAMMGDSTEVSNEGQNKGHTGKSVMQARTGTKSSVEFKGLRNAKKVEGSQFHFGARAGEKQVGKARAKPQIRPTRGLIFGPTKGEKEIVTNGKRLRVEKENVGRAGGAFVNDNEVRLGMRTPLMSLEKLGENSQMGLMETGDANMRREETERERKMLAEENGRDDGTVRSHVVA